MTDENKNGVSVLFTAKYISLNKILCVSWNEGRFTQAYCFPFRLQPIEETSQLIDVCEEFVNSKACLKADPSQFELLKVLGQGSFGKVICFDLNVDSCCI